MEVRLQWAEGQGQGEEVETRSLFWEVWLSRGDQLGKGYGPVRSRKRGWSMLRERTYSARKEQSLRKQGRVGPSHGQKGQLILHRGRKSSKEGSRC